MPKCPLRIKGRGLGEAVIVAHMRLRSAGIGKGQLGAGIHRAQQDIGHGTSALRTGPAGQYQGSELVLNSIDGVGTALYQDSKHRPTCLGQGLD